MHALTKLLACFLVGFFPVVTVAAAIPQEESIARSAYAKLSYAVDINNAIRFAEDRSFSGQMENEALRFKISDVQVGNLKDIAGRHYIDFTTKPLGQDAIYASPVSLSLKENEKTVPITEAAAARWTTSQVSTEDWTVLVGAAQPGIEATNQAKFTRYLTCTVTVSLEGKSQTYKAFWWFGTGRDGQPFILPGDMIVQINGGALLHFIKAKVYPYALTDTRKSKLPAIHDWVVAHAASCGLKDDVCCDLEKLSCGVPKGTLKEKTNE